MWLLERDDCAARACGLQLACMCLADRQQRESGMVMGRRLLEVNKIEFFADFTGDLFYSF